LRELIFVLAALTFGFYWGYKTRVKSETDPDLKDWIPFNDDIVSFMYPALFCILVIAGLLIPNSALLNVIPLP
jgi:hypothetical protein